MPLAESLRTAAVRLRSHPELVALGLALAVFQVVVTGAVAAGIRWLLPAPARAVGVVAPLLGLFLVLPLVVGVYELALEPDPGESVARSVRRGVATAGRRYPRVLATDATAAAASGLFGIVTGVGVVVLGTGARYVRYLLFDPGPPHPFETLYVFAGVALVGGTVASIFVRFADALTAFRGCGARVAVIESARAGWRHRRALAGFAVVLVAVRTLPLAVFVSLVLVPVGELSFPLVTNPTASSAPGVSVTLPAVRVLAPTTILLAGIVVTGITTAATATLHAAFYERHVGTAVRDGRSEVGIRTVVPSWSAGRSAVALLLVVAVVAGAVTVRTVDAGVHARSSQQPLATESPDEAVAHAVRNTASRSHRQRLYATNASNRSSPYRLMVESGIDHADRRAYTYFRRPGGERIGGYFSESTLALRQSGGRWSGPVAYQTGEWTAIAIPGWGLVDGGESFRNSIIPQARSPPSGWSVVRSTDSRLVVRLSDPDAIPDAFGSRSVSGTTPPLANDSHVTVYIDRERGVLETVRFHVHSKETGRNMTYRLVYEDVGTADLRRPAPIRDRRAIEHVWDVIYY